MYTTADPNCTGTSIIAVIPKAWNSGTTSGNLWPRSNPAAAIAASTSLLRLPCVSRTPLTKPDDPDVYMSTASFFVPPTA